MDDKYFIVEITETLQKLVKVRAQDENEAIKKVKNAYRDEKIILDSSDYMDTNFDLFEDEGVIDEIEEIN